MTRLALKNPIAVLMACVAVIVFSVVAARRMSVDTFPELTPPVLVVGTLVPGLGPTDIEKTITWRIEKYVSATPGVDHVQSVSRKNLSIVYVWFKWGTDLNAAQTLTQQQVAFAMAAVPKSLGVVPPFVLQYDPSNAPVVQVAVFGGGLTGPQLYDYAVNNIEPVLEGIQGVASASPNGGQQRQINVVVSPSDAQSRGLTSSDVAQAVRNANALLPSGEFVSKHFDSNVYTDAVPARIAPIGEAVVKNHAGKPVLVHDVARVEDGAAPATQAVSIDGSDAVYLNVLRTPGGNTLEIVDQVKDALARLAPALPRGMHVEPIFDQSRFVRSTYEGLKREILQALVLIGCVILIFLQSPRAVVMAAISIPISFAAILLVLSSTGQTLNAFTLGGLTLAMGPLIDVSVVVLEAIHRERHHGATAYQAALKGAQSVAGPVFAATLTTVAVLLPVLLLAGLAKKLFAPLALTVACGMFAGYFVSLLVTPVACRYFLGEAQEGPLARRARLAVERVSEAYARALGAVLGYRGWLIAAVAVMVAAAVLATTRLPSTFFPEIDESMERVYLRLAAGTSLEDSAAKIRDIGEVIRRELPAGTAKLVLTNVGAPMSARSAIGSPNAGPHMGFIRVELPDTEKRKLDQRDIADRIRRIVAERFPGVETLQWPGGLVASVFSNGYFAPLVVELTGEDLGELDRRARAVAEVARTVPGVRDVFPSLELDYPEVRVHTDRQLSGVVGVNARDQAQATLDATLGNINTPGVWTDPSNGLSYYVVTMYDPHVVRDPEDLVRIPVRVTDTGRSIPLGAYAQVTRSVGPIQIERTQLRRAATVMMQTEGRDLGSAAAELERKLKADPRTRGFAFRLVGQIDLMRTTFAGLGVALGLAVMVVFMVMASQFKSLRLPFVMLFTVPACLIGIVVALLAAGQGFSITALMGALMVIGIAMSNGILLVDEANRRFATSATAIDAVVSAARVRFVPIAMTSLATIIGLLPTALGLDPATASNRPLALAVVGGLTSSTLLSLFLVPAMFTLLAARPPAEQEQAAVAAPA